MVILELVLLRVAIVPTPLVLRLVLVKKSIEPVVLLRVAIVPTPV